MASNRCVYCNSDQDLNTSLTITLDDNQRVVVYICAVHAEDASVKSAKAKYLERKAQIDEVIERAKQLGINLQVAEPNAAGIVAATATPVARPTQPSPGPPEVINEGDGAMVIDTKVFDQRSQRPIVGASGVINGAGDIERHLSHDLASVRQQYSEQLPAEALDGKVEIEVVEGRTGQPLLIPTKRVDGTGTTSIRIAKTTDAELQRRTKNMARDTVDDRHAGYGPHGGYDQTRICPICKGTQKCQDRGKWIACKKCGGTGEIAV